MLLGPACSPARSSCACCHPAVLGPAPTLPTPSLSPCSAACTRLQADQAGNAHVPAAADAALAPTAMFSAVLPTAPARFGSAQQAAFVAALQARLPGARVELTRHACYPPCQPTRQGLRRALLGSASADVNATSVATAATEHHSGGSTVTSQSACPGRLVLNVAVSHTSRARLQALLAAAERVPHTLWSKQKVRRGHRDP